MNSRHVIVLLVLAVLALAAGLWLTNQRQTARDGSAGERLLPELTKSLNDLKELRIVTAGEVKAVTLKRGEHGWQVMERAAYPADSIKLRKFLLDLAELKIVEEKTSKPEHYAVLGVEDLKGSGAGGVRVELDGVAQPDSLIIGKVAGARSVYARLASAKSALLVEPQISVEKDPKHWVDTSLLDIAADRVKQVRVTDAKGVSYTAARERADQTDFTVTGLPKGRVLSSPSAANSLSSALAGLSLSDVQTAASDDWSRDISRSEYRLFDGTTILVSGRQQGEQRWIRLAVSFEGHDGKLGEQAAALKAKLDGWAYQLPLYKYDAIFRPLDQLLKTP